MFVCTFEFSLLPKLDFLSKEHYSCSSWQEFIDRTKVNPYLNLPGVGTEVINMYNHIPRRTFNRVPCEFDTRSLNPDNNLAHLWLTFGYLMNFNVEGDTFFCFNEAEISKSLRIAEILDSKYLEMDQIYKRDRLLPIINQFIIPQMGNIIGEYIDEKYYRTLLVNALFQLQIYIRFTYHTIGKCDTSSGRHNVYFNVDDHAFKPIHMFSYIAQISGFQRSALLPITGMTQKMESLTYDYLNDLDLNGRFVMNIYIKGYNRIATGATSDEILDRNKKLLKLKNYQKTKKLSKN